MASLSLSGLFGEKAQRLIAAPHEAGKARAKGGLQELGSPGRRLTYLGSREPVNLLFVWDGMALELIRIRRGGQANAKTRNSHRDRIPCGRRFRPRRRASLDDGELAGRH